MTKKRLFSMLIAILLAVTMVLPLFSVSVFAGTEGNGESGSGMAVTDLHNSVSGFSKTRTGYLCYITDASGTPTEKFCYCLIYPLSN